MAGAADNIDADVDVRIRRRRPRRLVDILHSDMTAGTLVDVLQHLRFIGDRSVVQIDSGIRDFIVRALQSRLTNPRIPRIRGLWIPDSDLSAQLGAVTVRRERRLDFL